MDLLDHITVVKIPENLKEQSSGSDPIVEKYIRIDDRLIRLERKALPPKVKIKESIPTYRWRVPRLDCRHVPMEYGSYCAFVNIALDKLEDHINGDISWEEFVNAWNKAKSKRPISS